MSAPRNRRQGGRGAPRGRLVATAPTRWPIDYSAIAPMLDDPRNCFEAAMGVAAALPSEAAPLVVHGVPLGTGGNVEGLRYWHAWVEVDGPSGHRAAKRLALDYSHGKETQIARAAFYRIGHITSVHRYSLAEAARLAVEWQTWGPWVPGWQDMESPGLPTYGEA